jgi:hypothetical protein
MAVQVRLVHRRIRADHIRKSLLGILSKTPLCSVATVTGVKWTYSTSNDGSESLLLRKKPPFSRALAFRSLPPPQSRTRVTPRPQPRLP